MSMAEGTSPVLAREDSPNETVASSHSSLTKRHSRNLSPTAESGGTTGSASSSPRVSRVRAASLSKGTNGTQGNDEELASSPLSESELKRKMKTEKDKKGGFFSNMSLLSIFSSPHHHKNSELHKIFTSLPSSEKLVDDYSCALQRDILIHGRLYVTQSWLCFYANIFSWETLLTIPFRSVQAITKEKTALIIPNAIQVSTISEKYGFASLVNRDVTYNVVFKCWQNSLLSQPLSPLELVKAARKAHGESTNVGSEVDLWGEEAASSSTGDDKEDTVMVSMPTHVEIGRIPPTPVDPPTVYSSETIPRTHRKSAKMEKKTDRMEPIYGSVPGDLDKKGLEELPLLESTMDGSHLNSVTDATSQENELPVPVSKSLPARVGGGTTPTGEACPGQQEYGEKLSLGGESMNSAEFETISLIEETGEIPCNCSEHVGRTILNVVYDTDVETIFRLLFTDSDFIRNFNKAEKTINVEMGEWQVQPDSSRLRDLSYTMALNYSFGPKFTHTTEHQVYSKGGQPGLKHIVDTEVVNHNIPYGDTFYTVCRYCLTRVAHDKTRLRVTANIKFKKTCWGLVKNLIERNAGDGLRTHYTRLDTVLKEHIASLPDKRRRAHRKARQSSGTTRMRHKRTSQASKVQSVQSVQPAPSSSSLPLESDQGVGAREGSPVIISNGSSLSRSSSRVNLQDQAVPSTGRVRIPSFPRMNYALTILLAFLVLVNMLLYRHLMGYNTEVAPPVPESSSSHEFGREFINNRIEELLKDLWLEDRGEWPSGMGEWPSSEEEWNKLMFQQLHLRWRQTIRYRDKVTALLKKLDKIESSLMETKKELLQHFNDLEETSRTIEDQKQSLRKNREEL